jgi:hypothetical protein
MGLTSIRLGIGLAAPKGSRKDGPRVAFQLHDWEQVPLSAQALDAEGNPAAVNYAWSSSDETVVAVTDNGDGTALAVASPAEGGLGSATVSVDVTDQSDGDVISGTFEIEVIAGDAVAVNITAGTPEAKP